MITLEPILVYGAGKMGLATIQLIKEKHLTISGIIDKNAKQMDSLLGLNLYTPEDCCDY